MRLHVQAAATMQSLSLDIVFGMLGASWLASRLLHAKLPASWWLLMPLTVWIIYAIDHLADGRDSLGESVSATHRFYRRHRARLTVAVLGATALDLLLATRLSEELILAGIPVAVGAIAYLFVAQERGFVVPKEICAALLYALALWFAPIVGGGPVTGTIACLILAHAAAALANLLFLSLREESLDRRGRQRSWVLERGRASATRALIAVSTIGVFSAVAAGTMADLPLERAVSIALAALALWPLSLHRFGGRWSGVQARALADFGFVMLWLPAWLVA